RRGEHGRVLPDLERDGDVAREPGTEVAEPRAEPRARGVRWPDPYGEAVPRMGLRRRHAAVGPRDPRGEERSRGRPRRGLRLRVLGGHARLAGVHRRGDVALDGDDRLGLSVHGDRRPGVARAGEPVRVHRRGGILLGAYLVFFSLLLSTALLRPRKILALSWVPVVFSVIVYAIALALLGSTVTLAPSWGFALLVAAPLLVLAERRWGRREPRV